MAGTIVVLLKELVAAGVRAGVESVAKLLLKQREAPPPHPTWKDVEHRRAQERASIEAGKKARR